MRPIAVKNKSNLRNKLFKSAFHPHLIYKNQILVHTAVSQSTRVYSLVSISLKMIIFRFAIGNSVESQAKTFFIIDIIKRL